MIESEQKRSLNDSLEIEIDINDSDKYECNNGIVTIYPNISK